MQNAGIWKFGGLGMPIGIDIMACIGRPVFRDFDPEVIDILFQYAESGALSGLAKEDNGDSS